MQRKHPSKSSALRPAAALFDFDGTLFDTDPIHWSCWDAALRAFGGELDRATYDTQCAGRATRRIAASQAERQGLRASADDIAHHKEMNFRSWLQRGTIPWMPGAEATFRRFQALGTRLAVVTSGPRDVVTIGLEQHDIRDAIEVLIVREDVVNSKPAPDCYTLCLARLGLPAAVCVAFEDTSSGVVAAADADLRCLAVRPAHVGPQDFSRAHRVFSDLPAAADWLLGQAGE